MRREFFEGRVTVHIEGRPIDHRIDPAQPEGPALDTIRCFAVDKVAPILRLYSPQPVFGAEVAIPGSFQDKREFPLQDMSTWHNGLDADGVVLSAAGYAYRVAPADCHTIIVLDEVSGMVIGAHTGRDNLLDRRRLEGKPSNRIHESIVDACMWEICKYASAFGIPFNPKRVRVEIVAGIGAAALDHCYDHPTHGEFNRLMVEDLCKRYGRTVFVGNHEKGYLDIPELIRQQFFAHGVVRVERDSIDTFFDTDPVTGQYLYWSNKRGDKERNLVLVVRNR